MPSPSRYLDRIPFRAGLKARLQQLYDYPRYFQPSTKRNLIFFYRNDGLQDQNVLFVQKGLDAAPEVLIDPNTWSSDGTVRLVEFSPSRDARYAVYAVSKSGSDWLEYRVLDIETKTPLPDRIEWVKVSSAAWRGDGFYYSRYPEPLRAKSCPRRTSTTAFSTIDWGHRRTPTSWCSRIPAARSVFTCSRRPRMSGSRSSVSTIAPPARKAMPCSCAIACGGRVRAARSRNLRRLVPGLDHVGGLLLVQTDKDAPNGRIVGIDPANPAESTGRMW